MKSDIRHKSLKFFRDIPHHLFFDMKYRRREWNERHSLMG